MSLLENLAVAQENKATIFLQIHTLVIPYTILNKTGKLKQAQG